MVACYGPRTSNAVLVPSEGHVAAGKFVDVKTADDISSPDAMVPLFVVQEGPLSCLPMEDLAQQNNPLSGNPSSTITMSDSEPNYRDMPPDPHLMACLVNPFFQCGGTGRLENDTEEPHAQQI